MGLLYSKDIQYMLANVNGNKISIPYIRMPDGQWAPLQQNWVLQQQQWNAQRTLPGNTYINQNIATPRTIVGTNLYPVPNQ